jgi:hypothetical protein
LSTGAASREIPQVPGARRIPISELDSFLQKTSRRSVFVFYDSATDPVEWTHVESAVNQYAIRNVLVLKGGLECWLSKHQADGMVVTS